MTRRSLTALAAILALSAGLAACGRMGSLERPGPIFGHAQPGQSAAATPGRRNDAPDPNRPVRTVDPRDESATPSPPRTLPIPGQGPMPGAPAPQGALPDPYANPPR
jgi:predicted small lipoprotein YifL